VKTLFVTIKIFLFLTLLTGIIYPLMITLIAQMIFPDNANGSQLYSNGKLVGSKWIAQSIDTSRYFHPRPSIINHNPLPSGGSNLSINNSRLIEMAKQRKHDFMTINQLAPGIEVPAEMIFASGSGLDPHISPEAAYLQLNRVSETRRFSQSQKQQLQLLIKLSTEPRQLFILGEERVNVLLLNLAIDTIQ